MPRNKAIRNNGHDRGRGFTGTTDPRLSQFDSHQQRRFHPRLQTESPSQPKRAIPTHFLAVPLNTNHVLLSQISAFQDKLLATREPEQSNDNVTSMVRGLDSSIVIDPRRFHLTLGVMTLDEEPPQEDEGDGRMNDGGNRGVRDAEDTKSAGVREPLSGEVTRSRRIPVSPQTSLSSGANTICDDSSTIISARIPLNVQSQSHRSRQGATVHIAEDVSSSTSKMLPHASTSTPTLSTPTSFATSQTHPTNSQSSRTRSFNEPKTVRSALHLLRSLKPQLDVILGVGTTTSGALPGATSMEVRAGVDVEHSIVGDLSQDVGAEDGGIKKKKQRKLVLNVILDKMDIMQPVKLKAKGKEKEMQVVDKLKVPALSSSVVGSAYEKEMGGEMTGIKQETVDTFATLASVPAEASHAPEDGLASNPETLPTIPRSKLADEAHDIWANTMYLSPREWGDQGRKLRQVCDLVHTSFKRAGYITEARPLKLHCTVLNTSKRKPAKQRGSPFCYSDVLASSAFKSLRDDARREACRDGGDDATMLPDMEMKDSSVLDAISFAAEQPTNLLMRPKSRRVQSPVHVSLGSGSTVEVEEVELWIMGSRGPNNEYLSCGGVSLG